MQLIPRITSQQLREQPDQTADILNRVIDAINKLQNSK